MPQSRIQHNSNIHTPKRTTNNQQQKPPMDTIHRTNHTTQNNPTNKHPTKLIIQIIQEYLNDNHPTWKVYNGQFDLYTIRPTTNSAVAIYIRTDKQQITNHIVATWEHYTEQTILPQIS